MIKNAFTLVEVLVSIALLGLISLFVSSSIFQTKKNNEVFKKQTFKDSRLEAVANTLYRDIYQSKNISISTKKKYSTLYVKSKNSLYGISEPYVVWLVLKQNDTLIRLESARKITLPIKNEFKKYIFVDALMKNCTDFSMNLSRDKKSILAFLDFKGRGETLFEIKLLR